MDVPYDGRKIEMSLLHRIQAPFHAADEVEEVGQHPGHVAVQDAQPAHAGAVHATLCCRVRRYYAPDPAGRRRRCQRYAQ